MKKVIINENISETITGDINISDLVGKVIEEEVHDFYGNGKDRIKLRKLKMKRVKL